MPDLRDQLIEAAEPTLSAFQGCTGCADCHDDTSTIIDAVWPLVEAALTRARQEGREQLAAEWKAEADEVIDEVRSGLYATAMSRPCRHTVEHPAHLHMIARRRYLCPGVSDV